MAFQNTERLQEAFSLALEDRSESYADLVSDSNVLLYQMKRRGMWRPFSGPRIRERLLYAESGSYTRYSGYQFLNPSPKELFADAEFTPKLAAVSPTLSGETILQNSGSNQLLDVMEEHINAAEVELMDRFNEDLHSDGTADGGLQVTGLQAAVPTDPTTGTYGGIDRAANSQWRTNIFDANSDFTGITAVTSTTIKEIFDNILAQTSLGNRGANLILCAQSHWVAFTKATVTIQRITNENALGALGFNALKYHGNGRAVDVVLEGGIGTAMPADITYFICVEDMRFRYSPARNFTQFGGKQMPVNQDAYVQHIGFYGNLTMANPRHMSKLYDSA